MKFNYRASHILKLKHLLCFLPTLVLITRNKKFSSQQLKKFSLEKRFYPTLNLFQGIDFRYSEKN